MEPDGNGIVILVHEAIGETMIDFYVEWREVRKALRAFTIWRGTYTVGGLFFLAVFRVLGLVVALLDVTRIEIKEVAKTK